MAKRYMNMNGDREYNPYTGEGLENARLPPRRADPSSTEEYDPHYGQQYYPPQYPPQHFADPTATPRIFYQQQQLQQQQQQLQLQHGYTPYSNPPVPQPHSTGGISRSGTYIHVPGDDRLARHQGSRGPTQLSHPASRGSKGPTHGQSRRRESDSDSQLDHAAYRGQRDDQARGRTRRESHSSRHVADGHRGEPDAQLQDRTLPDLGPHQGQISGRHSSRQYETEEEIAGMDSMSAMVENVHLSRELAAPPSIPSQIITASTSSTLDPRYQVRNDAQKFFKRGRVFSVLWHENAGTTADRTNATFIQGQYGEPVVGHIRRMVVAKEYKNCAWCFAIYTYGNRGLSKHSADASKHAIIYMEGTRPMARSSEPPMLSTPLEVRAISQDEKLSHMSRLNFSKLFTVEHNVKVRPIGKITDRSMQYFLSYARQEISI